MARVVFQCPVLKRELQWVECEGVPEDGSATVYRVLPCPACARLHFVNVRSGKLLDDD